MAEINNGEKISYFVHEAEMARQERTIKRLWILCIMLILLLVGTNAGWIWYESQFVDEVTTIEADASDGGNALGIVGDDNEVNYGEGESNN